jgi:hypothetical protein
MCFSEIVLTFSSAHVASCDEDVFPVGIVRPAAYLEIIQPLAGLSGGVELEHNVGYLGEPALLGGIRRDAVFQCVPDGLALDPQTHDGVFKGKARGDVLDAHHAGRIDLVAPNGARRHDGAVGVVVSAHDVAHKVAQVGLPGPDGAEAGVQRRGRPPDWFRERLLQLGRQRADQLGRFLVLGNL